MPEKVFWHTMSPARLHALFDAYLGRPEGETPENGPQRPRQGLFDYIQGGK